MTFRKQILLRNCLKLWGAPHLFIGIFHPPSNPMEINQDGYTMEVTGPEGVRVLVATKAKPNQDAKSPLEREFYKSFLDVSFCICVGFVFQKLRFFCSLLSISPES